ncbi:MAG: hypothetical protein MI861_26890 [Pirellulales bacterium]|nr:hypothetical protein [Pirellulales bacterium]
MDSVSFGIAAPPPVSTTPTRRPTSQSFAEVLAATPEPSVEPSEQAAPHGLTGLAGGTQRRTLHELFTGRPASGPVGTISIEDIRRHTEEIQVDLHGRIHALLERSGISLDGEVPLQVSPYSGQIQVVGDVPQREQIESVLASDPGIGDDFRRLSTLRALVDSADKYSEFAAAYARDPYKAVEEYSELFSPNREPIQFLLTETELS